MEKKLETMRELLREGKLEVLTIHNVKDLIGKRIQTIYSGYMGQDHIDEFVLGEIVSEYELAEKEKYSLALTRAEYLELIMPEYKIHELQQDLTLITSDNRNTYIRYSSTCNCKGEFHCSDVDRMVFFRVLE